MIEPNPVLTAAIDAVCSGRDLSGDEAADVLAQIMEGNVSEPQIAGFLIGLRAKGETVEELTGLARTMRSFAASVDAGGHGLLDTAGTGGGRSTFNVSTTAALIAAAAGCRVAKHGNRSATSLSGSADLLEALGARIDLGPDAVAECIERVRFGFMFAPLHHAATRFVVPVRKALAVRTIFNFLGPLTNPAGATHQIVGVSDPAMLETIAGALAALGAERALVVSGDDGLDEMSTSAPTHVIEVIAGDGDGQASLTRTVVEPADAGLSLLEDAAAVAGGTPEENATTTRAVFAGEEGPARDLALLNAGAALFASGSADSIRAGVEAAGAAVDSGAAGETLERFVETTRELAPAP